MVTLSILDQSPISSHQTAQDALHTSVQLAQLGEKLGYERYWIAEHHDLYGLACPNPDLMLAMIGAQTSSIRIGAGAVLLPYYKPFRVAETYNLLATLFPGRIDLGIGRAPGGSAEVSLALSDNYLKQVSRYSELIDELAEFLHGKTPANELFAHIKPTPVPDVPPKLWLLGTSKRSAEMAVEKRMSYAFGHFMTDFDGVAIVNDYRESFYASHKENPKVIVAVHVICAETTEEAHRLAKSTLAWSLMQTKNSENLRVPSVREVEEYAWTEADVAIMERKKSNMIIGNPEEVAEQLRQITAQYNADELMIVTITHEPETKFKSYELVANVVH